MKWILLCSTLILSADVCTGLKCIQCVDRDRESCELMEPLDCSLQISPDEESDGEFIGCGIETEKYREEVVTVPRYICVGKYRIECWEREFGVNVETGHCTWAYGLSRHLPLLETFSDSKCFQEMAGGPVAVPDLPQLHKRFRGKREAIGYDGKFLTDIQVCFCKGDGCNKMSIFNSGSISQYLLPNIFISLFASYINQLV